MESTRPADSYDHHKGASPLLRRAGWRRTALFLAANLVLFAGVNVFWRYLVTGGWPDFTPGAYYKDLVTPLGEGLLHPLSVMFHPWMIPTAGLLLAGAIFVPVMTAVLYRSYVAAGFVLMVAVIGHAPVLALTLAIGCVIAARTPLRSDLPFLATILAVLPTGAYLYLFGFADSQWAEILPLQRWVLVGPLLVAAVAGVISTSAVLLLARATRFRPGALCPVLAGLLAGSAAIFYGQIGPDELEYALIADGLAPGDMIFQPVKLATWTRRHDAEGLNPQALNDRLRDEMRRLAKSLVERCEAFLSRYADSRRAPEVLWLVAQCRSLQLDLQAFNAGTVRYSAAFTLAESAGSWRRVRSEAAGAPHAALADWRLGELAIRSGRLAQGDEQLYQAAENLERFLSDRPRASQTRRENMVFRTPESIPNRAYYVDALFRIRRLIWMIERNDALDDPVVAEALGRLLSEDPHQADYGERLGELIGRYESTRLEDNLKLAFAMELTDPYEQADHLILLAEDERTDAAVEANYQLGVLAMQTARARALPLIPKLKKAERYFQIVIAAPPNPWQGLARRHLARLKTP